MSWWIQIKKRDKKLAEAEFVNVQIVVGMSKKRIKALTSTGGEKKNTFHSLFEVLLYRALHNVSRSPTEIYKQIRKVPFGTIAIMRCKIKICQTET